MFFDGDRNDRKPQAPSTTKIFWLWFEGCLLKEIRYTQHNFINTKKKAYWLKSKFPALALLSLP